MIWVYFPACKSASTISSIKFRLFSSFFSSVIILNWKYFSIFKVNLLHNKTSNELRQIANPGCFRYFCKMRYFLEFSYKGTAYNGWQKQNNALGVQQVLEEALSKVLRLPIEITGSSRTDTGVH